MRRGVDPGGDAPLGIGGQAVARVGGDATGGAFMQRQPGAEVVGFDLRDGDDWVIGRLREAGLAPGGRPGGPARV